MPNEVNSAVMDFLVTGCADNPDVFQFIVPTLIDGDNMVDFKTFTISQGVLGASAILTGVNAKPLGRPDGRFYALPFGVLELLGLASPTEPAAAQGAMKSVAVDRINFPGRGRLALVAAMVTAKFAKFDVAA